MMKFFLLFIFFSSQFIFAYKYDVAVCAIFQNEAKYLREWIEFHKLVGVEHFYLYNNLSNDDYYRVLKPYIKKGEVELIQWKHKTKPDGSNWPTIQIAAYNHAIKLTKKKVKWLAIIDIDEFLFPVENDSLSEFLLSYENVAAVCVNWQMYGTSGIKNIPSDHLLIEDLIYKAQTEYGENKHIKSIFRPKFVKAMANPHNCIFLPGYYQVDPGKKRFSGPYSNVQIDKVRINHYWTRDENFFYNRKIPRRKVWRDGGSMQRANNLNKEIDKSIYKYVPKLRGAMRKVNQ